MSYKVLICDDNADILEITSMMLELEGAYYPLTEISSTLLIERALQEMPDVILLDLWMPILPGDELTIAIRSTPELAHIPIIIFSAAIDGQQKAARAGAGFFLSKPFDIADLLKIVELALNR